MRHWGVCCVLAGGLAGMAGCGWQAGSATSPQGGVAVVDLGEVAKSVGANTVFSDMVKMRGAKLNNELGKVTTDLKEDLNLKIEEVKTQFPETVPADEAKKLRDQSISANAKLQQLRSQAQVDLSTFTEQLKQQFRAEVRPIAQEIAAKKGFSIVIPKDDALLLSVSPDNDITNDVILALQTRNQKASADAKAKPAAAAAKPVKKEPKTAAVPVEETAK